MPLEEDLLKAKADLSKSESENFLNRVTEGELPTVEPARVEEPEPPSSQEPTSAMPSLTVEGEVISQEQMNANHPELMKALGSPEIEYCPWCDGIREKGHVATHKGGTVGVPEWMQEVMSCKVEGHAPTCRCHKTGIAVRIW